MPRKPRNKAKGTLILTQEQQHALSNALLTQEHKDAHDQEQRMCLVGTAWIFIDVFRASIAAKSQRYDDEYDPCKARADAQPAKYGVTHCARCQEPCAECQELFCPTCHWYFYRLAMAIKP